MALQRLKEAAEKAKCELSTTMETEINLPFVTADASGPKHLALKLTRAKLEQITDDLVQRSMGPVRQALKDAGLEPKDIDEIVLVGGMTRMPKIQQIVQDYFGKEPHKGVNPDEVVAVGAAIQAGILAGEVKDVLLLDVTPLSLGIETLGGVMTRLIERNTTIPAKKTEVFSTAADSQTSVEIHVLQGERELARDSRTLGKFHLVGIPPAPRGVPQIEVTFDIDANGILHVSAKDRATGKAQAITITASSGLAKDEVEKMVRDAEAHSGEDKKKRELIDLRNQADNLAYSVEKLVAENPGKVGEAEAKAIAEAVAAARKAAEGEDAAAIKAAMETLTKHSHKLAEELYRQTGGPGRRTRGRPGRRAAGPGAPAGRRGGRRVHGEGQLRAAAASDRRNEGMRRK